jgi:hypothetical protein
LLVRPTPQAPFRPGRLEPCFCGSGRKFRACCGSLAADRDPPFGVHVVQNFLDRSTCADWVRQLEERPRRPLGVIAVENPRTGGLHEQADPGRLTDRVDPGPLEPEIGALLARACREEVPRRTAGEIEFYEEPQVLRYEPGGRYERHADSEIYLPQYDGWLRNMDRDISLLVYLNDDFEGGTLSFVRFNYVYRPRAGDLVFFPSDNRYAHQADPLASGVRYVIASWSALVDEPRLYEEPPQGSVVL